MGFLTEREPDTTGTVGDAPSFATAGFLTGDTGDSGGSDSGDSGGGSGEFDPAIHAGRDKRNADGSYRKKRGRKPNSGTAPRNRTKADNQASVDALTNILVVIHTGIATATKTPEIAIEKDDAETLARATANVLAEFDITPDPKVTAIIGLIMAGGAVYGPMTYNIQTRRKQEALDKRAQQTGYPT